MELKPPVNERSRTACLLGLGTALGASALLAAGCGGQQHDAVAEHLSPVPIYQTGDVLPLAPDLTARVEANRVIITGRAIAHFREAIAKLGTTHHPDEADITLYTPSGNTQEVTINASSTSLSPNPTIKINFDSGDVTLACDKPPVPDCEVRVLYGHTHYKNGGTHVDLTAKNSTGQRRFRVRSLAPLA